MWQIISVFSVFPAQTIFASAAHSADTFNNDHLKSFTVTSSWTVSWQSQRHTVWHTASHTLLLFYFFCPRRPLVYFSIYFPQIQLGGKFHLPVRSRAVLTDWAGTTPVIGLIRKKLHGAKRFPTNFHQD